VCAAFLDLTIRGGMGGRETAQALRAAGFSAPMFATSGYSEDPVMANPTSFGFAASLGKPFSLQELAAFMGEWLPAKAAG
jgi:CheY-like chemotaxis protein